jgi:hypothetical protein
MFKFQISYKHNPSSWEGGADLSTSRWASGGGRAAPAVWRRAHAGGRVAPAKWRRASGGGTPVEDLEWHQWRQERLVARGREGGPVPGGILRPVQCPPSGGSRVATAGRAEAGTVGCGGVRAQSVW